MRIDDHESSSYVDFEPIPELSSSSFRISAKLMGYRVSYSDITLFETDIFLTDLETVLQKRSGQAILEGTDDFKFIIEFNRHDKLCVSFYLAKYIGMAVLPGRQTSDEKVQQRKARQYTFKCVTNGSLESIKVPFH